MTNLSDFQAKISRAISRLDAEIEAQAHRAGLDLVALVTNRVVQRGETSDGGNFSPYSTTPVPAWFYKGKSRNASAEAAISRKVAKRESVSYKEFRALNNLNTSPKNFEFTGEMWQGFSVLRVERSAKGVRVVIGGKSRNSADRIGWNSQQEGTSIIKPSRQEIQIVQNNLNRWVNSLIN